jgi:hypothetical protein
VIKDISYRKLLHTLLLVFVLNQAVLVNKEAAAGFDDTLLRRKMKQKVADAHDEDIQAQIQA